MTELATWRRNVLRAGYLLMAVGLGTTVWPTILDAAQTWPLMHGVAVSMLGAIGLLAVLGLRYPVQMLPLMFFEVTWKLIWLLRVALPPWTAGTIDAATLATAYECLGVVIVLAVIPWGYVFRNYGVKPVEPWRRAAV